MVPPEHGGSGAGSNSDGGGHKQEPRAEPAAVQESKRKGQGDGDGEHEQDHSAVVTSRRAGRQEWSRMDPKVCSALPCAGGYRAQST